ncbi:MAG: acetyl-CoA carboxylase biotin carboxyl carrier protein [Saprospiraceae bacterium]|nr:MAG: acetyl-CoA carboxylase biotin carboxyl carrier protein [Saprospiraceae bacterium]
MNFKEIQELVRLLNKSNLAEFKLEDGDFKLSIRTALYSETKTAKMVSSGPQLVSLPATAMPPAPGSPTIAATETEKPSVASTIEKPEENYLEIKSPMVGTFYRSASPEKPPYAEVGQKIRAGDVVCIIEAMKLFNEIESEVSGTIVKVLVDNEHPVEYNQVLFLVEPD